MWVPYAKLHGAGNSYVYIDARRGRWRRDFARLARRVADSATGLGGDGLIVVLPSQVADVAVRIFNRDGSEAEMCGNGVRALGKFLYDRGESEGRCRVETRSGVVEVTVEETGADGARLLTVDMGAPRSLAAQVELRLPDGITLRVVEVDMGNPHAVAFVGALPGTSWMARVGPLVERHPHFPAGVNFHAAVVTGPDAVRVRHWERGSGLTLACGSGACAVAAAGQATGRFGDRVAVQVPGGRLVVERELSTGHLRLTGPAAEISRGLLALT
jgi:diaminopimelate epimerase